MFWIWNTIQNICLPQFSLRMQNMLVFVPSGRMYGMRATLSQVASTSPVIWSQLRVKGSLTNYADRIKQMSPLEEQLHTVFFGVDSHCSRDFSPQRHFKGLLLKVRKWKSKNIVERASSSQLRKVNYIFEACELVWLEAYEGSGAALSESPSGPVVSMTVSVQGFWMAWVIVQNPAKLLRAASREWAHPMGQKARRVFLSIEKKQQLFCQLCPLRRFESTIRSKDT